MTAGGVQTLTVSSDNPLVLFNLDVSLEWDARQDPAYLEQLKFDLQRASELLYDWTDGQAALGRVNIYQALEKWNEAHLRIYANNRLRPNAGQGGIVSGVLTETIGVEAKHIFLPFVFSSAGSLSSTSDLSGTSLGNTMPTAITPTQVITYEQSQVRMPATWNRYGEPGVSIGEDWPRALAHELGHYAFFLDDDYLGLDHGAVIAVTSCPGAMADPYSDDDAGGYDEFHPVKNWSLGCEHTLSNLETGRASWQTIKKFYPVLKHETTNYGPNSLPLAVTQIRVIDPITGTLPLEAPFISLLKGKGGSYVPESALAYLFQGDDWLAELGSPVASKVRADGARQGDRLCVFDPPARRLGCQELTANSQQLQMRKLDDWQPDILVRPVTSQTIEVELTAHDLVSSATVKPQLYPRDNPPSGPITL
ncbi:MAG TPA: hypothetical protein VLA31_09885, partial [Burkholderiaceae bacterium]|nr:hypothetical protein [Burkholderiaceae bacterium]